MRLLALFGSLLALTGSFLRYYPFIFYPISFQTFQLLIEVGGWVYTIGIFLALLSGFYNTTRKMKIGTLFAMIGFIGLGFLRSLGYTTVFAVLINGFVILALIYYLLGCISFRKRSKMVLITGILLVLSALRVQGYMGIVMDPTAIHIYYLYYLPYGQIGVTYQGFLWGFHFLVFSFSKKLDDWDADIAEDRLSVEKNGAFSSYIPQVSQKSENKKKFQKKTKNADDMIFDF